MQISAAAGLSLDSLAADPRPLVVVATARWCPHCRTLKPKLLEALNRQVTPPALLEVDVEERPDLARALRVSALPTLILRRQGREVGRRVGAPGPTELDALLQTALTGTPPAGGGWAAPSRLDRGLRLAAGFGLALVALAANGSPWLLAAAALLLVSALHDRCPLLRMLLTPRNPTR